MSAILKDEVNTKWYGICILESIMLDSSPHGLWKLGTKYLGEVLSMSDCRSLLGDYINKSITLIQNNESVPQAIKLLMVLINSQDPKAQKNELKNLESLHDIRLILIQSLKMYMIKAQEFGPNIQSTQVVQGTFSHEVNIKRRLLFLEYIIYTTDGDLRLNIEQLDDLWILFVSPKVSIKDTDLFFK